MITCGVFRAQQIEPGKWELTCTRLPDWREVIDGTEAIAADAIIRLQAEFRDTWEVAA